MTCESRNHAGPPPRARQAPRAGFSLTELLIALSILGIALPMVAALFVTGMLQVGKSVNATEGTLIAGNGIAVAEMMLTAANVTEEKLAILADADYKNPITEDYQKCPFGDPEAKKGFVILGRTCEGEGFQLISVAYTKTTATNKVRVRPVTSARNHLNQTQLSFTETSKQYLKVGSPLILTKTGQYVTITAVSENKATVDRELSMGTSEQAYVIVEYAGHILLDGSPATGVRIVRTGLKAGT